MTLALQRTMFEISRAAEYFDAKELQAQTGQAREDFASVALKELVDNALDACETSGVAPEIQIRIEREDDIISISVSDNGAGIEESTINRILDFNTRTSDKAAYCSPTRGAQGNALKTIVGMPCAMKCSEPVIIESRGLRHSIAPWIDPAGEPRIEHHITNGASENGTTVTIALPAKDQEFNPLTWARAFSVFNPHAMVQISISESEDEQAESDNPETSDLYQRTVDFPKSWRKYLPTDHTSAHWYDQNALAKLVFAHIADARRGGRDLTLREFVRDFRGLTQNAKAKTVCDQLDISRLSEFEGRSDDISLLHQVMREHCDPPSPAILGTIGEEHFKARLHEWYGVKRHWYKQKSDIIAGIPFVFEAFLAETERRGELFTGVNFSPTFTDPLAGKELRGAPDQAIKYGIGGLLGELNPEQRDWNWNATVKTTVAVHLVCPSLTFLDRGKTSLSITPAMAEHIGWAMWKVCETLQKEQDKRRKDAAKAERAAQNRQRSQRSIEWSLKDAVFEVMPEAVRIATGDGTYPTSARHLYYQVRPAIQKYTSKSLDFNYFTQTLLTLYKEEHGPIKGLYREPRGIIYEPHTGVSVHLGTREVDNYIFPAWLYNKILYVEKQGLWPILQTAKLAERYDMAIVAGQGYASEAVRTLFESAERNEGYELYVLHDADPAGYNIARTLREETRRMPGYRVNVVDLGLNLEEALDMGLETEEFTRNKALPQELELSEIEWEYFVGRRASEKGWICRRIELNAMSAPQLVQFIERKLEEAGASSKVIPPDTELPQLAQGIFSSQLYSHIDSIISQLLNTYELKEDLGKRFKQDLTDARAWIIEEFDEDSSIPWRKALDRRFRKTLDGIHDALHYQVASIIEERLK